MPHSWVNGVPKHLSLADILVLDGGAIPPPGLSAAGANQYLDFCLAEPCWEQSSAVNFVAGACDTSHHITSHHIAQAGNIARNMVLASSLPETVPP